jgi:hypothetical protein
VSPHLGVCSFRAHQNRDGIIFDVIECLIQRNFGFATTDVRVCYRIIKEKLYNPQYSKVVFVLHSQGGIEGSMILDWLLQELPQNLLAKLEVYTFGNAANHFNNPHRHVRSQDVALRNPLAASTDSTNLAPGGNTAAALSQSHGPPNPPPIDTNMAAVASPQTSGFSLVPGLTFETSSHSPSAVSGRAIGHIEHYAHTTDFVALWGVLHFATSAPETHSLPRFIGRVFARTTPRGGHQFGQHYLNGMFPLSRHPDTGELDGCAEVNEFMESEIVIGVEGDEMVNAREAMEVSWLGGGVTSADEAILREVEVHGSSPVEHRGRFRKRRQGSKAKVKVKQLSRLWQYRNGRSPDEKPPGLARGVDGVVRMATL